MNIADRVSDTQATVILTALAVLMLGAIFWGLSNPASSKVADKFEVIVVTEGTVTINSIPPEALVGPNEQVELDLSDFKFTVVGSRTDKGSFDTSSVNLSAFEFAAPQMPNIPDFHSPSPNELIHTPTTIPPEEMIVQPKSEDSAEAEGK